MNFAKLLTVCVSVLAMAGLLALSPQPARAGAMEDLQNAAQDGKEAVAAPTEEGAKAESNETFDTPHDSDGD
jgi:hypothetical protein